MKGSRTGQRHHGSVPSARVLASPSIYRLNLTLRFSEASRTRIHAAGGRHHTSWTLHRVCAVGVENGPDDSRLMKLVLAFSHSFRSPRAKTFLAMNWFIRLGQPDSDISLARCWEIVLLVRTEKRVLHGSVPMFER